MQLVWARDVKQAPGRPKTDKLDAVWAGQADRAGHAAALRSSLRLRSASCGITCGCAPTWPANAPGTTPRLEKLLEDALIKVSAVASKLDTKSVRDMLEALIAGERDPEVLADLARGRMKVQARPRWSRR